MRTVDSACGLFAAGEAVVVAVSGGADSLVLLHVLRAYAPERDLRLHVAHLDHLLRPESTADAAAVASLAAAWDLPASFEAQDVGAVARARGRGVEEAARYSRYGFLARTAARVGAGKIAVAHTADDQAETVLMNLVRGTGLTGLAGMRPLSDLTPAPGLLLAGAAAFPEPRPRLARPFLTVRRSEVLAYVAQHGLQPQVDATNLDPRFLRNRLRQQVMPLLEDMNPLLVASLLRLAASVAGDVDYLEAAVERAWPGLVRESDGRLIVARAAWAELPPALQRRAVRRMVRHLVGPSRRFGWQAVEAVREACASPGVSRRSLPAGLVLELGPTEFTLELEAPTVPPAPLHPVGQALTLPGTTLWPGGWALSASVRARQPNDGRTGTWQCHMDADRVGIALRVRGRRPGDRLAPLGMAGRHRGLQDVLVDARVPAAVRDGWPLVMAGAEIVWVVGIRQSESSKVRSQTRHVVVVEARPPTDLRWPP